MPEIFLVVTVGREYVSGILSVETRNANKYHAMQRIVPVPKTYLAPNVSSAKVEKTCSRQRLI